MKKSELLKSMISDILYCDGWSDLESREYSERVTMGIITREVLEEGIKKLAEKLEEEGK